MAMTLITTNTSSNAANSSFTSSIDSTYKLYIFKFIDVNPATDGGDFQFNGSDDTSSWSYDITKTTTSFAAYNDEGGGTPAVGYGATSDLAQSTSYQTLSLNIGNGGDESCAGTLWLFNPSNTTYVKHFYSQVNHYHQSDSTEERFIGGYFNTTAAITALDFKMDSGNMDGTIKMYGVG
jgi:hypothetical protein